MLHRVLEPTVTTLWTNQRSPESGEQAEVTPGIQVQQTYICIYIHNPIYKTVFIAEHGPAQCKLNTSQIVHAIKLN